MAIAGSEVRSLRAELVDAQQEVARLRGQTEQLIASNRDLSSQLVSTAQRTGDLLKVIVAFRMLLESSDSASALRTIEEILVNVVGTEDFVVLTGADRQPLRPVAGMGPAAEHARSAPQKLDDLGRASTRVVPMYIDENVVGAIVIKELLPHREPLNASDDQVLSLLSRFGASAIMTADQRKFWTRLAAPEIW